VVKRGPSGTTGLADRTDCAPAGARESWAIPSTHLSLHYHLVFSTKNREPSVPTDLRGSIHECLGGTIRGMNGVADAVGGTSDHAHVFAGLRATHCRADEAGGIRPLLAPPPGRWRFLTQPVVSVGALLAPPANISAPAGGSKRDAASFFLIPKVRLLRLVPKIDAALGWSISRAAGPSAFQVQPLRHGFKGLIRMFR